MGKVIHATYRFLMDRCLPVPGTYTEQAPYGRAGKEDPKTVDERKSRIYGLGDRRRKGKP
jgi:hypothetical protein